MVQRISRPGNKSAKPHRKNPKTRALNALATAEAEGGRPDSGIARHRLGEAPQSAKPKRRRRNDSDEGSDDDDNDSESERSGVEEDDGVKWRVGRVDSDEDEDLDSDEAFGESDEERFADWTFRASQSGKKSKKIRKEQKELTLDSEEEEESELDSEDQDQDGEGWMDLSQMLDAKTEEKPEKRKRAQSDEESEEADSEEDDEDSEEDDSEDESDSDVSMDDEDEEEADPERLDALHDLISSLPTDPAARPSKRQRREDPNEGKAVSEYNLTSQKITLDDLLPTVNTSDATIKKSLKLLSEDASKGGKLGKLAAPLAKRQQDRLDRSAAYKETKKTLDRWKDTVKANREAEHLQFPLPGTGAELQAPEKFDSTTHAKPLTTLEEKIAEILKASNMTSEKQILKFEDMQTNKLPVEEVQKRTAELRRARELMYREEARAKRIKKIKSKSYHRQLKRDRKKEAEAVAATLKENGDFDAAEDEEERDRRRAEERMSLRFKQSKWAKGVKESGRAGWDDEAREGTHVMMQREDELRRRIHGKRVFGEGESGSDSSSGSDDDSDGSEDEEVRFHKDLEKAEQDDTDMKGTGKIGKNILSLKFMQKAEALKKQQNFEELEDLKRSLRGEDESTDEDEREVKGRRSYKPVPEQQEAPKFEKPERLEFEEKGSSDESSSDDDDVEIIVNAANKPKNPFTTSKSKPLTSQSSNNNNDEAAESNPWLSADLGTKGKKSKKLKDDTTKAAKISSKLAKDKTAALSSETVNDDDVEIDVTATLPTANTTNPLPEQKKMKKKKSKSTTIAAGDSDQSEEESEYASDGDVDKTVVAPAIKQRNLVKKAFAGDNVVYEFEKEKKQTIKDEGDQVTDLTLPGWGSWVGEGVSKKKRRTHPSLLQVTKGVAPEARKDAKLKNVIVSEKKVRKNTKYNLETLPHPFETRAQYERSLRIPIGPEWTARTSFQDSTKPRVIVKKGMVVEPMKAPFSVKNKN